MILCNSAKTINIFNIFSGEIVLNYTASSKTSDFYYEIIEDKTTPDAVLLAEDSAVVRMYSNGTTEVVLGDTGKIGCV